MSDQHRLSQLATLLYGLAAFLFAGTVLELVAARHYEEPAQLIPFALCLTGFAATLLAWKRPGRASVIGLRVLMAVTAAAAGLGVWKHLESNMASIAERTPGTAGVDLFISAMSGRAPLLASGVLAAGACIAITATYAAGWDLRTVRLPARACGRLQEPAPAR